MRRELSKAVTIAGCIGALLGAGAAKAQNSYCLIDSFWLPSLDEPASYPLCGPLMTCQKPVIAAPAWSIQADCEPMNEVCEISVSVPVAFPGNHQNDALPTGTVYSPATLDLWRADGTFADRCGLPGAIINTDTGRFGRTLGVSCPLAQQAPDDYLFVLDATSCPCAPDLPCSWGLCTKTESETLEFASNDKVMCVPHAKNVCGDSKTVGEGSAGMASGSAEAGGEGTGPQAYLRYRSGGAGNPRLPGAGLWSETLGRNWSHDYAQRIVHLGPLSQVWLITADALFVEFRDRNGDGTYEYTAPSTEKRTLVQEAGGWTLTELDGVEQRFDLAGHWLSTLDPNGVGKRASYTDGQLLRVDLPDGRREEFGYHPNDKLASIREVGIDGVTGRTWKYTWAGDDLDLIELPDGRFRRYRYEDPRHPGFLTQAILTGTNGTQRVETAWQYDAAGRSVKIWRGSVTPGPNGPAPGPGAVDVWSYRPLTKNAVGLVTKVEVTDPLGQVSIHEFGYDPRSETPRLVKTTGDCPSCGLGANAQLEYTDASNPLLPTRKTDARGTSEVMTYDANGMMTSRTEAFGTELERTTTWELTGPFPALVTREIRPSTTEGAFRTAMTTYDGLGNPIEERSEGIEEGQSVDFVTAMVPTAQGVPQSIDPPGHGTADVTSFGYDPARGGLVALTRTDPIVGTTSMGYDALNQLVSTTDPNGVVTESELDALGRVLRVIRRGATAADDLVTIFEYTPHGELFRTTLPDGNVIENVYDPAGRLVEIHRKPNASTPGERVVLTLDAAGNRTREERQRWDGTQWIVDGFESYVYGTRCRLDKVVHADGSMTELGYDCNENLSKIWDANHPSGNQSAVASQTLVYDRLNRVTSATQPWTGAGGGTAVTSYGYDLQDHLKLVRDAEGNETEYTVSDRDLVTFEGSEVAGNRRYSYDEHGELVEETDGRGITATRTLDAADRVTLVDSPGTEVDTRFVFENGAVPFSKGRLTRIERGATVIDYRYDRFGRLTQDGQLGYGYTKNGNTREIAYPGGGKATYGFDFADRESSLLYEAPGQSALTIASGAKYLAAGPLRELDLGNGVVETREFDTRYFPTRIRASKGVTDLLDWQYTTDDVGNPAAIADGLDPSKSKSYSYQDHAYFLTSGNGPWGNLSWTYDKVGDRLSETRDGVTSSYRYGTNGAGGRNQRLAEVTPPTPTPSARYFFDDAGNQIWRAEGNEKERLAYDEDNRLASITIDAPSHPTEVSAMKYDGRGFLARAELSPAPRQPWQRFTEAVYSSEGVLHARRAVTRIGINTIRNAPTIDETATILYFAGRPVAIAVATTTTPFKSASSTTTRKLTYLTTDHLGTPALATNEAGAMTWSGGFEPFGKDKANEPIAGTFLRFPGQWLDRAWSGSGLTQNLHRWYRSDTGRFSSGDPLGLYGSLGRYVYAQSAPETQIDPTGETPWGLVFAGVDLGLQLLANGGQLRCVNWKAVGFSMIGGGLLNAVVKGALKIKTGSTVFNANWRRWYRRNVRNYNGLTHNAHHWGLERNQGLGQYI